VLFHLHRPRPPLDRFVELVTYYEGYLPAHSGEKLLPDGAVEIVVDLTDTPKRLFDRGDLSRSVSFRKAWISGMRNDWIAIEAAPGASMTVIRFRPGGAFPILGFPAEAITDSVVELDSVLGAASASLRDRILEAPTLPRKMAAVESWLFERAAGRLEVNAAVEHVTGRLFAPAGVRVRDLAVEIGFSERHLLALFRRWVGLSPKQYGRVRRFQQVLEHVAARDGKDPVVEDLELRGRPPAEPDWADVALQHGYYDQSHLARDFRELAGETPHGYVAAFRGLVNYLPMEPAPPERPAIGP
jgi:AraC-like DNA-binding protein